MKSEEARVNGSRKFSLRLLDDRRHEPIDPLFLYLLINADYLFINAYVY